MGEPPRYEQEGIRHATVNGHRLHLRLTDPSAENFLWVDGRSPPLVLDQVAAEFLGHLIDAMWEHQQGDGDESERVRAQVVDRMFAAYGARVPLLGRGVSRKRIRADLDRVFGTVMTVAEGGCQVEAGLVAREVRHADWGAPARMDLALTYRCNLDCPHCYAGGPREMTELSTDDWRRVLENLWRCGVPQVVFTGGEPTLRDDLVDLVVAAEPFVTGLVTNGVKLEELAEPLRGASLDYAQVTIEARDAAIHDRMVGARDVAAHERTVAGIRRALDLGIEVVTNTTLTRENAAGFPDLLRFGRDLGLKSMACNGLICSGRGRAAKQADTLTLADLKRTLEGAHDTAREIGIGLQWYTPTCYHELDPLALGFGPKSCSAAAHNMTVQPDGTVLPCQSWPETVGRILVDAWSEIWTHPVCVGLRERAPAKAKEECRECAELPICGGGCPLDDQASCGDES
jgi:radical SAM protein with 4Fe4S-binding SPASM domain